MLILGKKCGPVTRIRALLLTVSLLIASSTASANPNSDIMRAFLSCDVQFFKAIAQHGAKAPALRPLTTNAAGVTRLAVPDRSSEEGQSLTLNPPFTVNGIDFIEFIDEINRFEGKVSMAYYWGFNTDAKLAQVLSVVQGLLTKDRSLTADGDTWARIDVFEQGAWRNISQHAALKGKPALLPERALIVETHEGGGTRVVCGLQAAPLPGLELKRLRPDL
jgi:hypothetical protein